ncbi:MAG: NUDIX domain-containing protein [Pseudomonadota bacterium]|nr:NUDIX domain-containing protein [Pseudomonadota bacterium]
MNKLRKGVVGVIINTQDQVLLFERSDRPNSWQFPQGGLKDLETPEEALYRELLEEIGTNKCNILKKSRATTVYHWPKRSGKHLGQEHIWFLCSLQAGEVPNLKVSDGSFVSFYWDTPQNAIKKVIDWKRPSYERGLKELGL